MRKNTVWGNVLTNAISLGLMIFCHCEGANNAASNWEYPSPQQFYKALVRKGWDFPEQHAESMVVLHNRLNEYAWDRVLQWETRFHGGSVCHHRYYFPYDYPRATDECVIVGAMRLLSWNYPSFQEFTIVCHVKQSYTNLSDVTSPSISSTVFFLHKKIRKIHRKLTGLNLLLRSLGPPFDRHDWVVRRPATGKKVRYVIDYYSARSDPISDPTFYLDVRPASDNLDNVRMRIQRVVVDNAAKSKAITTLVVFAFVIGAYFLWPSARLLYSHASTMAVQVANDLQSVVMH